MAGFLSMARTGRVQGFRPAWRIRGKGCGGQQHFSLGFQADHDILHIFRPQL
jgi:hypothetical protein